MPHHEPRYLEPAGPAAPDERPAEPDKRRRLRGPLLLLAVGAGLGVLAIRSDLGWRWWIVALLLVAAAVALLVSAPRRGRAAGYRRAILPIVAGAVVVLVGVGVVLQGPVRLSTGWQLPEDVWVVGAAGTVLVTKEDDGIFMGRDTATGDAVWSRDDLSAFGSGALVGDTVYLVGGVYSSGQESEKPVMVLDALTGETRLDLEVSSSHPARVVVAGDVVAFLSPEESEAWDVSTGEEAWQDSGMCTRAYSEPAQYAPVYVSDGLTLHTPPAECWEVTGVLDVRTGEVLLSDTFGSETILTDTHAIVTSEAYRGDVVGHPITGGTGWETRVMGASPGVGDPEFVFGSLRVFTSDGVVHIDTTTGEARTVLLPDTFRFDDSSSRLSSETKARHVLVTDEDDVAILDTLTGTTVDVPEADYNATTTSAAGDRTAIGAPVTDAVGHSRWRYVIADADSDTVTEVWADSRDGHLAGDVFVTGDDRVIQLD